MARGTLQESRSSRRWYPERGRQRLAGGRRAFAAHHRSEEKKEFRTPKRVRSMVPLFFGFIGTRYLRLGPIRDVTRRATSPINPFIIRDESLRDELNALLIRAEIESDERLLD